MSKIVGNLEMLSKRSYYSDTVLKYRLVSIVLALLALSLSLSYILCSISGKHENLLKTLKKND